MNSGNCLVIVSYNLDLVMHPCKLNCKVILKSFDAPPHHNGSGRYLDI